MDNAVKLAPFILSKEVPYGEIYITNLHRAFLVAREYYHPLKLWSELKRTLFSALFSPGLHSQRDCYAWGSLITVPYFPVRSSRSSALWAAILDECQIYLMRTVKPRCSPPRYMRNMASNTACPKSLFLYFISLYFSTIELVKQFIETKVASFNLIHYFHTCCTTF